MESSERVDKVYKVVTEYTFSHCCCLARLVIVSDGLLLAKSVSRILVVSRILH